MDGCYLLLCVIFLYSRLTGSTECVDGEWQTEGDESDIVGTITSPDYPLTYPNNYECIYTIRSFGPYGTKITFTSFDLEDSVDCAKDRLCNSFTLENIDAGGVCRCGTGFPVGFSMKSGDSPNIFLKFVTDGDTVSTGWSIDYEFECWSVALIEDTEHTSPGYPNFMIRSESCIIQFVPPNDGFTHLFFVDVDFPGIDGECTDTYLQMIHFDDGFTDFYHLCDTWFDYELVGLYLFKSMALTLNTGDESDAFFAGFRGYKVIYKKVTTDVCTEPVIHTGQSGTVKSINYPVRYYNLKECTYIIDVGEGNNFTLVFRDFMVEQDLDGMCYDNVTIYDGDVRNTSPEMFGIYCGTKLPGPFWPTSHVMSIVLSTDVTVGQAGFKAQYLLPDGVKDFVPATGSDVYGNWLRVGFNLISVNNEVFQHIWKTGYLWRFEAYARHADICDVEFEDVAGWVDEKTGVVYFDFGFRPGRYHINFRAYSYPKMYDFSHPYTIVIDNKIMRGIATNTGLKKYAVDFIVKQEYAYFTRKELVTLKTSLHASIQQLYDDVHLVDLEFSKDHKHGYLHVRAYLRGRGLMTKLRLVCAFVAQSHPFKLCMANGKVKSLDHERKVHVLGRDFGHGTDIPCENAMFVKSAACSCPCSCKGALNVELP